MGAMFGALIFYGIISFLIIFLVGWLAFDSFWWALLAGFVVLFSFY